MATKSTKLPAQLYVVAKLRPIYDNGKIVGYDTPLGFLNAYEPNKSTWYSKKKTQDEWAYMGYMQNFKLEQHGAEYWITGQEYAPYDPVTHMRAEIPFNRLADPQPAIWDNVPLNGFEIKNSVSRYSTSNKLWRVLDPRGWEFEISTACLEELMQHTSILKGGLIEEKCAWMANKNLVVVP